MGLEWEKSFHAKGAKGAKFREGRQKRKGVILEGPHLRAF